MEKKIIDFVIANGERVSSQEYYYTLQNPMIHEQDYQEALLKLAVYIDVVGDKYLTTYWEDARLNEFGKWETYEDYLAGWVAYDDLAPSEWEILSVFVDENYPNE